MRLQVGRAQLLGAPASMARYRQRASECRAAGERSPTAEERAAWFKLADQWTDLVREVASRAEHWARLANPPKLPTFPVESGLANGPIASRTTIRSWPDQSVRVLRTVRAA